VHLALVIVAGVALAVAGLFVGGRSAAEAGGLILLLAAAGFVQLSATYRSSKRTRARPRKEYLLWSLCCGVLTLAGLTAVGDADQDHLHLLTVGLLGATV